MSCLRICRSVRLDVAIVCVGECEVFVGALVAGSGHCIEKMQSHELQVDQREYTGTVIGQ